jgi:hypothetical protein
MSTKLAVPRAVPWGELDEFLHEELMTCLRLSAKFLSARSFCKPSDHACERLRNHRRPAVPDSVIAKTFGISKPTIRRNYLDRLTTPPPNGRPALLAEASRNDVSRHIAESDSHRCEIQSTGD